MNDFEKAERLTSLAALGFVKAEVDKYATPDDRYAAVEACLLRAAQMARHGADLSVLTVLEYRK